MSIHDSKHTALVETGTLGGVEEGLCERGKGNQ